MAKCFVSGYTLKDNNGKSACLKVYRDKDPKELSICFDNSCGGFKDECRRIEAVIFANNNSTEVEATHYIGDSKELSDLIYNFVNGII
jgi:hypothetical protein